MVTCLLNLDGWANFFEGHAGRAHVPRGESTRRTGSCPSKIALKNILLEGTDLVTKQMTLRFRKSHETPSISHQFQHSCHGQVNSHRHVCTLIWMCICKNKIVQERIQYC